jgi:hypothetical protein
MIKDSVDQIQRSDANVSGGERRVPSGRHQTVGRCGVRKAFRRLHVALTERDYDRHASGRKGAGPILLGNFEHE